MERIGHVQAVIEAPAMPRRLLSVRSVAATTSVVSNQRASWSKNHRRKSAAL